VILANPPFMSPKGGIKPHKRFSVQASRSEVLFVDYMAEHLTATGRAAIVVPEGIIFQSGTAYKALRKMLVDNSLVAVVSLPAGVFNPYSGVKTSILILDKRVHKQTDQVLFVKVQNDGFNLGAQRRAVVNSDLPEATRLLRGWMLAPGKFEGDGVMAQAVARVRIGASGDFNLSGERYRESDVRTSSHPFVAIRDVAEVASGFGFPLEQQGLVDQEIPFLKVSDMNLPGNEIHINSWNHTVSRETLKLLGAKSYPVGTVIFPKIGAAIATNKKRILSCESTYDNNVMGIVPSEKILSKYLYALLQSFDLSDWASDSQPPSMRKSVVEAHTIPLPPLEVQRQIVTEIEGYQKIIDGARQVLDNYKPHVVVNPDWPVVPLGTLVSTSSGGTPSKNEPEFWTGVIPWVSPKDMKVDFLEDTEDHISKLAASQSATKLVGPDTLLCVVRSGILQHTFPVALTLRPMCFNQDIVAIRPTSPEIDIRYLFYTFKSNSVEILKNGIKPGVTVQSFHSGYFKSYPLPLPDLETQRAIVAEIEAEQSLVAANRELIRRFEAKIKTTIARVWSAA